MMNYVLNSQEDSLSVWKVAFQSPVMLQWMQTPDQIPQTFPETNLCRSRSHLLKSKQQVCPRNLGFVPLSAHTGNRQGPLQTSLAILPKISGWDDWSKLLKEMLITHNLKVTSAYLSKSVTQQKDKQQLMLVRLWTNHCSLLLGA